MRFLDKFLITHKQAIVVLGRDKPCKHCRKQQSVQLSELMVSWEIPHALVVYAGDDVAVVCLGCLDERRARETIDC